MLFGLVVLACVGLVLGQEEKKSSYAPGVMNEDISVTMARLKAEKTTVMKRQQDLLQARYDLRNDPAPNVTMTQLSILA